MESIEEPNRQQAQAPLEPEVVDIPNGVDLLPIHNTTYGLGKYGHGVIRHSETRMKFKYPDHKDQYVAIASFVVNYV